MAPHCQKILASKRLILLKEMLEAAGHSDVAIAEEIARGFNLGGPIPSCTSATLIMDDLRTNAVQARRAIINATKSSGDATIDFENLNATMDEVERGWLDGPRDHSALGATSLVTRRFGVTQGRPIDNYLESGVNSTASASDTISAHAPDCIAASLAHE